jgi:hypothetical protein
MDHEAMRKTLAQCAGEAPDASAMAEATLNIWRQVATRLTPVIGIRGVDALFSRSLYLTSKAFPWLSLSGNEGNSHVLRVILKVRLASQETAAAAEASDALLVTFTELLATLIGESLTDRLLVPVWAPRCPAPEQENA